MSVTLTITKSNVAELILSRPEKRNAFDDKMIYELIQCIEHANTLDVRALVLKTEGDHFSAGADLKWMKSMINNDYQQNLNDSMQLATLMKVLAGSPLPTICAVQGAAFGGALGLIACCDIAICQDDAQFCLSEVKLGLIPAVISPYVIKVIGERAARRYFITAEIFDAHTAKHLGLIHQVTGKLDTALAHLLENLIDNGPVAVRAAKQLINDVALKDIDETLIALTAQRIADIRVSDEGQEGLKAFFDKRPPRWQK